MPALKEWADQHLVDVQFSGSFAQGTAVHGGTDVDLFILRGVPGYIRSDNGPEFVAEAVRKWITAVGPSAATLIANYTLAGLKFGISNICDQETGL